MSSKASNPDVGVDQVDTSFIDSLVGYNARRATVVIISSFLKKMDVFDLRPFYFSVASLIARNPGITSSQLCSVLGVLPPNLVALVATLEKRGLIARRPHPNDGRATGLYPTPAGLTLIREAEEVAFAMELESTSRLTTSERKTLIRLLQKVYR